MSIRSEHLSHGRYYICVSLEPPGQVWHSPLLSGRYLLFGIWLLRFARGGSVASLDFSFLLTSAGSRSAFASNSLTCHISVSDRKSLKAGIPERRIQFFPF